MRVSHASPFRPYLHLFLISLSPCFLGLQSDRMPPEVTKRCACGQLCPSNRHKYCCDDCCPAGHSSSRQMPTGIIASTPTSSPPHSPEVTKRCACGRLCHSNRHKYCDSCHPGRRNDSSEPSSSSVPLEFPRAPNNELRGLMDRGAVVAIYKNHGPVASKVINAIPAAELLRLGVTNKADEVRSSMRTGVTALPNTRCA